MAFGLWLLFTGGSAFLYKWILHWITGIHIENIMKHSRIETAQEVYALSGFLLTNQIIGFGLSTWVVSRAFGSYRQTLATWPATIPMMILAMGIAVAALPAVQTMILDADTFKLPKDLHTMEQLLEEAENRSDSVIRPMLEGFPVLSMMLIGILPAFAEELFFRGLLLNMLRRHLNVHFTVWLIGLIFSLVHGQVYGVFARWLLGVMLGYLVVWSGSVWPAVAAHFSFNSFQVVLAHVVYSKPGHNIPAGENYDLPFDLGLEAGILVALGLYLFYKLGISSRRKIEALKEDVYQPPIFEDEPIDESHTADENPEPADASAKPTAEDAE